MVTKPPPRIDLSSPPPQPPELAAVVGARGSAEPTAEQFIEDWPLYTRFGRYFSLPERITRQCPRCAKETTWLQTEKIDINTGQRSFRSVAYGCGLCGKQTLVVFVALLDWRKVSASSTYYDYHDQMKVGQIPAPAIEIPAPMAKALGADADLYRRALVSRNQGYGIGALAYMRRVVENKTHELIDVCADLAAALGIQPDDVSRIRIAKDEKVTYDEKLRIASEAIPVALKPGGANPLGLLFDLVSEGLHAKDEAECLAIADEIRDVFEHVFTRFRAEVEDKKQFVEKVAKLAGRKKLSGQ